MIRPFLSFSVKLSLSVLFALLVLSGCASLSKEECLSADWYTIGYEDGLKGRSRGRLGNHRKACVEYGVTPETHKYFKGYDDGLVRYCVPGNGYKVGLAGHSVRAVCPSGLSRDFSAAYQYGRRIYIAESELRQHRRLVDKKGEKLKQVRTKIIHLEKKLKATNTPDKRYAHLIDKSRALLKREAELELSIAELQAEKSVDKPVDKGDKAKGNKGNKGKEKGQDKKENQNKKVDQRQHDALENKKHGKGNEHNKNRTESKSPDKGKMPGHDRKREKALENKHRELERVRHAINKLEIEMHRSVTSHRDKINLLSESTRLARQEGQLEAELGALERKSVELRSRVHLLKRQSPY